jgi:hypothetical protein
MRSLLFWGFTLRRLAVSYRRLGTACWPHRQGSKSCCLTLGYGTDRLSRNVGNYDSTLPNFPVERRPQVASWAGCSGGLLSHVFCRCSYALPVLVFVVLFIFRVHTVNNVRSVPSCTLSIDKIMFSCKHFVHVSAEPGHLQAIRSLYMMWR